MGFTAAGDHANLLIGGRNAATLSAWSYRALPEEDGAPPGRWEARATVVERDDYWLGRGEVFDLRLTWPSGTTWRLRRAFAQFHGDAATITGTGEPEDA